MLTRRRIFIGGIASVICAPAIVRAESLMPIRALIVPMQPIHAGFIERLRFHCMEQLLKNGWTTDAHGRSAAFPKTRRDAKSPMPECTGCWCESAGLAPGLFFGPEF